MAILLFKWLLAATLVFGGTDAGAAPKPAPHPLYVSITEINHNATEKTLEISCKIFTDDFEKTLMNTFHKKVDFATATADNAEAAKMVTDYIKANLSIKLDGKAVNLEYVGFEKENDAVWSFFQVSKTAAVPKKISVNNTILYDSYDKQMNLMHVSVGGNRKSTRLNYPDKET